MIYLLYKKKRKELIIILGDIIIIKYSIFRETGQRRQNPPQPLVTCLVVKQPRVNNLTLSFVVPIYSDVSSVGFKTI